MSATKWTDYLTLPGEVTDFEKRYVRAIHKVAMIFFWAHLPVLVGVAALAGTGMLQAALLTALVLSGPTLAYFALDRSSRLLSVIYGVTAMCMGGLLVHLGQGPMQIEMHFYFFVLLALLAVLANPTAIVAAALTVAAHHAILFFVHPASVFNYKAELWVVGVHALFVVLESVGACFVARSFFDNVVGLDKIVRKRTAELDARNQDMRTVLDHVDEGLITLDAAGWVGPERSAAFSRWFGGGAGSFADIVRPADPAFAAWFDAAFEQLQADILPLEVAVEQLPKRLSMGARTLEAQYQAIADLGVLRQMLVVLKDVTADLSRARAEAEQRDVTQLLERLGRDRQGFLDFFEEATDIVNRLTSERREDRPTEARLLHTLKGNAGLFGLLAFAQLCHDVESNATESGGIEEHDRGFLLGAWERLHGYVAAVTGDAYRNVIQVRRDDFDDVVVALRVGDNVPVVASVVESWGLDPVQVRLLRLSEYAGLLAERLAKPGLTTQVVAGTLRVDGNHWGQFWASLVHVIRNAVDHGVEPAVARRAAGKPEAGTVKLGADIEGDEFVVRISDDGAGIDWTRVAARAERLGMPRNTESELVAALLTDGFSTRDAVTGTSGRGVGLGAVKEETERRHGRLVVSSKPGLGTTWEFRFPKVEMRSRRAAVRPSACPRSSSASGVCTTAPPPEPSGTAAIELGC